MYISSLTLISEYFAMFHFVVQDRKVSEGNFRGLVRTFLRVILQSDAN